MNTEQERTDFEAWAKGRYILQRSAYNDTYIAVPTMRAWEAWKARAALQSQDLEDALRYRWIFTADMDEQTITFATLNACVALRNRVKKYADEAIDHARRIEGES